MFSQTYVKWDDPKVEPKVQGEEDRIDQIIGHVTNGQRQNFAHHRHGFRGTHVKSQGIVKGTMTIEKSLPSHLAQGLFATPGEHPIAIRYANEPSFLQDDRAPGPRGMGMKVFNVEGEFMDAVGSRNHVQDFTFNNAPILELRDVTTTAEIFDIRMRNFNDGEALKREIEQRSDKDLQFAPAGLPNQHFLSYTMYSQSAYRYGDFICKYQMTPTSKLQQDLENSKITDSSDRDQHSKWLHEYFQKNDAEYDFRIQLCRDLEKQPVEDTSVQWNEEQAPFETVAKIIIPAGQDPMEPQRRAFWDDKVKLNVWYGLKAFQPLGSVNRLRKKVYQHSSAERQKVNATKIDEVASINQIP